MTSAMPVPLCFVLMPFGQKKDLEGTAEIDFDRIYEEAIRPAITDAGMEPSRADAETTGGIIHKAMFERLLLCDYAVADLTTANANVFYELGVRHTARPKTTVAIFAKGHAVPFDLRYLRYLSYDLGPENRFPEAHARQLRQALGQSLQTRRESAAREAAADSPLFQLLQGYQAPELAHLVTDTFRDRARTSEELRHRVAKARRLEKDEAVAALRAIQKELSGTVDAAELGSLVDLYLSYRAVEAWDAMINLHSVFPLELQRTVTVREQLAFALNRRAERGDREQAVELLAAVEEERGPNPETSGLIGRTYKDRWSEARQTGDATAAEGYLDMAINAYLRGFQADWRDFYPGINALTLLDVRGEPDDLARRDRLLPVVQYAVDRRFDGKELGYWEYATQLELAVLKGDRSLARRQLAAAVSTVRESWEPKTSANNLGLIADARAQRGEDVAWICEAAAELSRPRR